jgi:hypothetical protein
MLLIGHVSTVSSCKKILLMYYFVFTQGYSSEEHMCCVYVPTNHLYIGDIFLVSSNDVIRPNISVREGIGTHPLFSFFPVIFMYALNCFDINKTSFCRNCCLRGHVNASSSINPGK